MYVQYSILNSKYPMKKYKNISELTNIYNEILCHIYIYVKVTVATRLIKVLQIVSSMPLSHPSQPED